jgi:hypothetical protein
MVTNNYKVVSPIILALSAALILPIARSIAIAVKTFFHSYLVHAENDPLLSNGH